MEPKGAAEVTAMMHANKGNSSYRTVNKYKNALKPVSVTNMIII